MDSAKTKGKPQLHWMILGALVAGGICGLAVNFLKPSLTSDPNALDAVDVIDWIVKTLSPNVGGIFLTLIFMTVIPMLFAALALGVAEIGDIRKIGRIGVRSLVLTIVLSGTAVGLGLLAVNVVQPGKGIDQTKLMASVDKEAAIKKGAAEKVAEQDPPLMGIIPKNPLLEATRAFSGGLMPFMFFALIFGIALASVDTEKALPVIGFLEGIFAVCLKIIDFAMKFAPIGVFFLVFASGANLGIQIFQALAVYAVLVLVVLAIHQFGTYSLAIKFIAKRSPVEFFKQMKTVMMTAFATSSSNATLPTALKAAEEDLSLPRDISSFVLTVGATANQNGTALFEGVTILFLCQIYQVPLDIWQQLQIMLLAIVAGIGTAGVPGGSWPMIASVLVMFKVDPASIGIILGIDRILDMSRTVLNVTGDMTIAACVSEMEGRGRELPEMAAE